MSIYEVQLPENATTKELSRVKGHDALLGPLPPGLGVSTRLLTTVRNRRKVHMASHHVLPFTRISFLRV